MKKIIKLLILIFLFINFSCKTDKIVVYIENTDNKLLEGFDYSLSIDDSVFINNYLLFKKETPSYKTFNIKVDRKDKNMLDIYVNNDFIRRFEIKKSTNYLFISLYIDSKRKIVAYILESPKKIKPS